MPYQTEICHGSSAQTDEVAGFLASVIASGDGPAKDAEGAEAQTWRNRLSWWWASNPYCKEDSPKGYLLRGAGGDLVGFAGYIPHDYVRGGDTVPSLISTTTFVRRENREAVLGFLFRTHSIRESYQLIDGGPSKEMEALLGKLGYTVAEPGRMVIFPVKRRSFRIKSLMFRMVRLVTPRANRRLKHGKVVTDIGEVREVPTLRDGRLRKHVDLDTLRWYLRSGSRPKTFVGWCDGEGALICYVIGVVRHKWGMAVLFINDACSFAPESDEVLDALVEHLATEPEECKLPDEVDLVAWPTAGKGGHGSPFGFKYDPKLYYRIPSKWGDSDRFCLPLEGDKGFL